MVPSTALYFLYLIISSTAPQLSYLLFGLAGGDSLCNSCCLSTASLSVFDGKNSGAVVAKKISLFPATSCILGMDIV